MRKLKVKHINLIARLKDDPRRDASSQKRLWLLLPVAVLVLGLLAYTLLHTLLWQPQTQSEIDRISDYLTSVTQRQAEAEHIARMRGAAQTEYDDLTRLFAALESYPALRTELYADAVRLARSAGVEIVSVAFARDTGLLTLSAVTDRAEYAALYVQKLTALEWQQGIGYEGYSLVQRSELASDPLTGKSEQVTTSAYHFAVQLAVKPTSGEEVAP